MFVNWIVHRFLDVYDSNNLKLHLIQLVILKINWLRQNCRCYLIVVDSWVIKFCVSFWLVHGYETMNVKIFRISSNDKSRNENRQNKPDCNYVIKKERKKENSKFPNLPNVLKDRIIIPLSKTLMRCIETPPYFSKHCVQLYIE